MDGYILLVDAIVWKRRRSSWIRSSPAEFTFLAIASIPLWLVFEFYNLFIDSWDYVNLPDPPWRYVGYAWSFATIGRPSSRPPISWRPSAGLRGPPAFFPAFESAAIGLGAALLIAPFFWPSLYLAAAVWLGFILLLDPINARVGADSLFAGFAGDSRRVGTLAAAGLICGVIWEFWNYWSRARWVYNVPILPEIKLFEMPVLGYLGFPAFALECFTMYVFLRHWAWRGPTRSIAV